MEREGRPAVAVAAAPRLTLVAALENTVASWAPFYVGYAALATALPFLAGAVDRSAFRRPTLRHVRAGLVAAVLLQGLFRVMTARVDLPGMFGRVLTA